MNSLSKLNNCFVRRYFATQATKTKIGLLGVPFKNGSNHQKIKGTELAPNVIRDGGLIEEITYFNEHVDLKDFGDLRIDTTNIRQIEPKNMLYYNDGFQSTMHRLCEKVSEIRNEDRMCVTLGGDHAIAVGE